MQPTNPSTDHFRDMKGDHANTTVDIRGNEYQ